jgi:hypothetical protein
MVWQVGINPVAHAVPQYLPSIGYTHSPQSAEEVEETDIEGSLRTQPGPWTCREGGTDLQRPLPCIWEVDDQPPSITFGGGTRVLVPKFPTRKVVYAENMGDKKGIRAKRCKVPRKWLRTKKPGIKAIIALYLNFQHRHISDLRQGIFEKDLGYYLRWDRPLQSHSECAW